MRHLALSFAVIAAAARRAPSPRLHDRRPAGGFVTGGVTAGGTVAGAPRGALGGGELGLVRIRDRQVAGLYLDGGYDFGVDAALVTAGPELAIIRRSPTMPLALGVDGGAAIRFGDDGGLGATGRVFLTVAGAVSLYGRYLFIDGDADRHAVQVGLTLKFPLAAPFGAGVR
jgi:hypothetical protein